MAEDEETFGSGASIGGEWRADQNAVEAMEEIRLKALADAAANGAPAERVLGGGKPADDDNMETFFYEEEPRTRVQVPTRAAAAPAPTTPAKRETPLAQLKPSPWMPSVWSSGPGAGGGWGAVSSFKQPTSPMQAQQQQMQRTGGMAPQSLAQQFAQVPMQPQAPMQMQQQVPPGMMHMMAQQQQQQQQQQFQQQQQQAQAQAQAQQFQMYQQSQMAQMMQMQQQQRQAAIAQQQRMAQQQQVEQGPDAVTRLLAQLTMQQPQQQQQQRPMVTSAADLETRLHIQRAMQAVKQQMGGQPPVMQQQAMQQFSAQVQPQPQPQPQQQQPQPQLQSQSQPVIPQQQPQPQAQPAAPVQQQAQAQQDQKAPEQKQPVFFQPPPRLQTYEPFIRDPSEPLQWKGGKKYMRTNEISEIVSSHYDMLRAPAPYVEDYYRLNYLSKRQLGTAQQLQYLQQHKPVADAVTKSSKREALPSPYVLGKMPFVTSKTPRPMVMLTADENGTILETDHIGIMKGEHYNVLLGIENCLLMITDTEDVDKLTTSTATLPNIQLLQEYFKKRRMGLGENLATYICALCNEHPFFLGEVLGVRKGAAMLMRALRLMPTQQRIAVAQCYVRAFSSFSPAPASSDQRHMQLELAQAVVEASRAASAAQAAMLLRSFASAYTTPEQWVALLRLSETICVAGAVLQRGGELGMHKAPQIPEGTSPEDAKSIDGCFSLWRESYATVHRRVVEALHGVYRARVAGMSAVPPVAAAPLPSAVWNMLAALALLSSPEQKEVLRGVIGAVVGVGGLEQSASNPAVLALHHILLH